jgi:hypothetical protein
MDQARLLIINIINSFPTESQVKRRSQCTAAGQKYQVRQQTIDEEVVMTPRSRVPMRSDQEEPSLERA